MAKETISLDNTHKALIEIRRYPDLKRFKHESSAKMKLKYKVSISQLNFLIEAVEIERANSFQDLSEAVKKWWRKLN